jgi:hypothetical protein
MIRKIVNFLLFNAAWFACVLGATRGWPWLGPLTLLGVVAVGLALSDDRRGEIKLLASAAMLGFLFDTGMTSAGFFYPLPYLLPPPFSPPWLIALWINLAATLNVSLTGLKRQYPLAAVFGATGGPLAYYSGAKLGAVVTLPGFYDLLALAAGWAGMTPLLIWLAAFFRREI